MQNQGAKGYQETLLVDTLDRMRRNPEGRKVVHLHLSQLLPPNRTPVRIKIVTRMFRTLESGRNAQIFSLSNDDMVMIITAGAQRDVNNILHRIRKLYEGDPITVDDGQGADKFVTWCDLQLDAAMAIHRRPDHAPGSLASRPARGRRGDASADPGPARRGAEETRLRQRRTVHQGAGGAALAAFIGTTQGQKFKQMIRDRKKGRTILARCDSDAAVKVGQQLGNTLFQGRYVDQVARGR